MATRLKTVQYAVPTLLSLTDATLTDLSQITISLPETGTKTILKAWVDISMDDKITVTGGSLTTSIVNLRLGAASYTSTDHNISTKPNTGENISWNFTRDFTSHFVTNWTGTSMTCDIQVQMNQTTGTTRGMENVCVMVYVTYQYDDTSTTQLKTVLIPLDAPKTVLPTTKTSHDTVPALDTYLPENSKVYKSISIVVMSNTQPGTVTDFTVSMELSDLGVQTTGIYEGALSSDRFVRHIFDVTSVITTNVTHTFNLWSSLINSFDTPAAYMVVTYEFNASTTTSVMNSLQLPMEIDSPFGGLSALDSQKSTREIWIEEENPVRQRLAFFMYWQGRNNDGTLYTRIGTGGGFKAYISSGSGVVCGNKNLMIRDDNPIDVSFVRGRNILELDQYVFSTSELGGNLGGFWILNYTSDVSAAGIGAHNHTVLYPIATQQNIGASLRYTLPADSLQIPEENYFLSAVGFWLGFMQQLTQQGVSIKVERLAAGEGGMVWERMYADLSGHDNEMGAFDIWCQSRNLFYRWTGDTDSTRFSIENDRRYVVSSGGAVMFLTHLTLMTTYHSIPFTVSGTVSGSLGGTVTLSLHRESNGEKILETTRVGDGSYSFTWYDNTEEVYVVAYEDEDRNKRTPPGLAA